MKYDYIDSIRGIAILLVLLVHSSVSVIHLSAVVKVFSMYGQMGVQLFFVASAFTLCLSMDRRQDERWPLLKYGIRRYFRIAPAYYFGVVLYFLLYTFIVYADTGMVSPPKQYSAVNLISNFLLIHGFIPSANNSIVPGGWSIGTEVAFYVCFPFLLIVLKSMFRGRFWLVVLTIVFFGCLSLGVSQLVYFATGRMVENNRFLYFNLFNQLPVFVIGMGYYELWKLEKLKQSMWVNCFGFVVLTGVSMFFLKFRSFQYSYTFLPFFSALSFVFLMEIFRKAEWLNVWVLRRIGQVSYSMYLIHFIFAFELAILFADDLGKMVGADLCLLIIYLMTIFATFGLALLSERFIEKPSVQYGRKLICFVDEKRGFS